MVHLSEIMTTSTSDPIVYDEEQEAAMEIDESNAIVLSPLVENSHAIVPSPLVGDDPSLEILIESPAAVMHALEFWRLENLSLDMEIAGRGLGQLVIWVTAYEDKETGLLAVTNLKQMMGTVRAGVALLLLEMKLEAQAGNDEDPAAGYNFLGTPQGRH